MNQHPLRVMLVEDSPSDAELVQERLSEIAANVFVFTHLERLDTALSRLAQEPFDVLLLDLTLPDSFGADTFIRARAAAPRLPIVVFTGLEDESVGFEAVRQGVQDYLVKGQADGRQIARSIRYAIERKQAEAEFQRVQADLLEANHELQAATKELQVSNETLEARVEARTADLKQRTAQLQALAGELTRAEESERRRVAQVIHDQLQQLLVAARFNLEAVRVRCHQRSLEEELQEVSDLLSESLNVSRLLTTELSPSILHQAGLGAALEWLGRWYDEKHGLTVKVEIDTAADVAVEEVRITLFQAVRELLFNVVKHGRTKSATVKLSMGKDRQIRIEISDEGAGFDPAEVRAREGTTGGFGLFSIRERLEYLGGRLEVKSAPGHGSRFTLHAPMAAPVPVAPTESGAPAGATAKPRAARKDGERRRVPECG
jgi:signal transduction histidine kinase